ncbi:Nucleotide-binding universal stress protein, UspA family [Marinococcus luteus]|uniref:Nucleotide-binding universal stress protein, UspA family n=1 Tax=Marinococcus luteus TaxID=1122204 RepID=A0A1H2R107_9BACI|nr:universal stress protein [Marinococcus luteus]SDW12820.1 Nucleotide-binding universal stress protein, UspA family [Marinococcus luteus]
MYKTILAAVDRSEEAKRAARTAILFASKFEATLVFAHVVNERDFSAFQYYVPSAWEETKKTNEAMLQQFTSEAESGGVTKVETVLRSGAPKSTVAKELAPEFAADLLVTGASGMGTVEKLVMGSVSSGILRRAREDVLIVRKESAGGYKKILIAVDGSEEAGLAFEKGVQLALQTGAELFIVHVYNSNLLYSTVLNTDVQKFMEDDDRKMLEDYKTQAERLGVAHVTTSLLYGAPKLIIPQEYAVQHEIDLIVSGASGANRTERLLLGSVAEGIAHRAICDVLVVRQPLEHREQ